MARIRVAVVGDVHGEWKTSIDEKALQHLKPDLVLFTGDFGDGDVNMVKDVVKLQLPKAVILGNHDCWGAGPKEPQVLMERMLKKNTGFLQQVVDKLSSWWTKGKEDYNAVEEQIRILGEYDVGLKKLDYPHLKISVVGSRPFSLGGDEAIFGLEHVAAFYGASDFKSSAKKISELLTAAPKDNSIIVLGHTGPSGLGSKADDLCGRDFTKAGGDAGDPDLEESLKSCEGIREVPLVAFGHMHEALSNGGHRKMVAVGQNGSVYLNAAVVPRTRNEGREREFAIVDMVDNKVVKITETWVKVERSNVSIVEEKVLLNRC